MSRSRSLLQPAVKVAAAGLGSVVAGPLGGAIGGLLGDTLGGASSELIKKYADKFGDKAAEKLVDESEDALLERLKSEAPTLEAAYRTALQLSLKAVKSKVREEYGDWFENWDHCLGAEETLRLAGVEEARLTPESVDRLFDRVLVRIDAQGASMLVKSTSLQLMERPVPAELVVRLREALPEKFEESFKALIVSEKYEAAWRALQLACGERLETLVRSVKEDTTALRDDAAALRAGMEELLRRTADRAVQEGLLTAAEARAATAEAAAAEWEKKYLEVMRENPSLDDLLKAGDLKVAAEKKRKQIEQEREEQARSYFELGQIEALRFDFARAADAYGEAWRLRKDPTYGFAYAYCAQRQNRFVEAVSIYERLIGLYTAPPDIAITLNNLAILYVDIQRFGEAEKAFEEALKTYRELASKNPDYLRDVAGTLNNLANLHHRVQRFGEAERGYDEALKTYRELASKKSEAYLPDVATTLNNLAILFSDVQRLDKAEKAYEEALTIYLDLASRNVEAYLPDVATTLNNLANLYGVLQRFGEAEKAYEEALRIRRDLASRNAEAHLPDVAMTLNNLADLYLAMQRFGEAAPLSVEAEQILLPFWLRSREGHGDLLARILGLRSELWIQMGRSQSEACELARRGLNVACSPALKTQLKSVVEATCGSDA